MVERIMAHIHNYFERACYSGTFTIENNKLSLDQLIQGQYFRIVGSLLNDGVYINDESLSLRDEVFKGCVYSLAPPKAFLDLCAEIGAWVEKNKEAIDSPYQSENVIGVYSYTLKSGSGGSGGNSGKGNSSSWENRFYSPLNQWRKLS